MKNKLSQYGDHFIDDQDIKSVSRVLRGNRLTSGKEVEMFEKDFNKKVGSKYSISCSNGTSALHLSLLSLGIKKGDLVIVPSITFVATYNSVLMTGAKPLICDVNKDTGLVGVSEIDELIKKYKDNIRAIIVVHLNGNTVRVDQIKKKYKWLKIIEDSCHALGSTYKTNTKKNVGDCAYSDLSCFSFHPVKNITTGEGGMITTNNKRLRGKLLSLRNHCILRLSIKDNRFPYEINNLGYNYRLTDFQCALGRSQLKKLESFKRYRNKLVEKYLKNFRKKEELLSHVDDNYSNSFWHLFVVRINFEKLKIKKNRLMEILSKKGIGTQIHYIPLFNHGYIKKMYKYSICGNYPGAKSYYSKILTLPLHNNLKLKDINYISKMLIDILEKNS